jgi:hypothetical protein
LDENEAYCVYLKTLASGRHEDGFDKARLQLNTLDVVDVDDLLADHLTFKTDRVRVRAWQTTE